MRPLILSALAACLLFTVNAFAQRDRGLTEVERDACISFPKVTPAESMKEGVHFTRDSVCMFEDYQGNCDSWHNYLVVKYHYRENRTVDYYTSDGRLVTSKKDSSKREISITAAKVAEAEAKFVTEIEKIIFKSDEPVCADSFYK